MVSKASLSPAAVPDRKPDRRNQKRQSNQYREGGNLDHQGRSFFGRSAPVVAALKPLM